MFNQTDKLQITLIVSYYKRKGYFNPKTTKLKKSCVRQLAIPIPHGREFSEIFTFEFGCTLPSKPPRKFYSSNLDYSVEWTGVSSANLEMLMRRGLGYRIIFNMDKRVYDPKDPTTLPDVTLIITDLFGKDQKSKTPVPREHFKKLPHNTYAFQFLETLSGCQTLEVAYTFDRVTVTKDGVVELIFEHYNKLLDPEQLQVYKKYEVVLGHYVTADLLISGAPSSKIMRRFTDHLLGLTTWISENFQNPSNKLSLHSIAQAVNQDIKSLTKVLTMLKSLRTVSRKPELLQAITKNLEEGFRILEDVTALNKSGIARLRELFDESLLPQLREWCSSNSTGSPKISKKAQRANFSAETVPAFCFTGDSVISQCFASLFKRSSGLTLQPEHLRTPNSSNLCKTGAFVVQIDRKILKVWKDEVGGSPLFEFAIFENELAPEEGDDASHSDGSHSACSLRNSWEDESDATSSDEEGRALEKSFGEKNSYCITAPSLNSILIRSRNPDDGKWLFCDLMALISYLKNPEWTKKSAWGKCVKTIAILQVPFTYYSEIKECITTNSLSIVCRDTIEETEHTIIRHLDFKSLEEPTAWSSLDVTLALGTDMHEGLRLSENSIYFSERTKQLFFASTLQADSLSLSQADSRSNEDSSNSQEQVIKLLLWSCTTDQQSKQVLVENRGTFELKTDFISRLNHYWLEKKGRVFAYALQTNKQHFLTVHCYHNKQFVKLADSGKTIGSTHKLEKFVITNLTGQSSGCAFKTPWLRSRSGEVLYTFYTLTPDF